MDGQSNQESTVYKNLIKEAQILRARPNQPSSSEQTAATFAIKENAGKIFPPAVHGGEVWAIQRKFGVHPRRIIDFSSNVNPLGPPRSVLQALQNSLWQISSYPDSEATSLRQAVADSMNNVIEPSNVVVGNGSTELIYLFTQAFARPRMECLIPIPTYGEYEVAVMRAGGKPSYMLLNKDLDWNTLRDGVTPSTRLVFICNPNNPTGTLIRRETLVEIFEETSKRNILVLLDESYVDFVDKKKYTSLVDMVNTYENTLILRSFTKTFGIPGLRIGYGIASHRIISLLEKLKMPWNVNSLAQMAAKTALKDKKFLQKTQRFIKEERSFLRSKLAEIKSFTIYPSETNFLLINVEKAGYTSRQLKEKLLAYNMLVRDCTSFRGLDKCHIRVAVRHHNENEKLLKALSRPGVT